MAVMDALEAEDAEESESEHGHMTHEGTEHTDGRCGHLARRGAVELYDGEYDQGYIDAPDMLVGLGDGLWQPYLTREVKSAGPAA